jgi:hypothetical protein
MFRIRLGAAALGLAGVLFVLYPVLRPWHDESTADGAAASMGSSGWVLSHFFAMLGFILVPLGLLALRGVLRESRSESLAATAFATTWIGVGLTLPYYGAEDFGLHAAAKWGLPDLVDFAESLRYNGLAITMFGIGLVLVGLGGVLAGVAVWRSGVLTKAAGLAYAAGMALFLPQFFTPSVARIGHGILLGAGAVILAVAIYRAAPATARRDAVEIDDRRAGIMAR